MVAFSSMGPLVGATVILAALSGVNSNILTGGFWRMRCHSPLTLARIDPLVNPGTISDHAHTIHGGLNFGMNTTYDDLQASDCTTCAVAEDKSVYWTPSLHFKHADGTIEVVGQTGGMLSYYFLVGTGLKAFPAGFQMIAGNSNLRNYSGHVPDEDVSRWGTYSQFTLGQMALGFNCLNYLGHHEDTLYRHYMPDKAFLDANCPDGLRLELVFPSCNDGRDDSPNHKDHMAYGYGIQRTGDCPPGFTARRFPTLMFETIRDTHSFAGVDGEFVLSNGDPTGYGYHGDFINGWDEGFLQKAIDDPICGNPSGNGQLESCPVFAPSIKSEAEQATCAKGFKLPTELKNDDCTKGKALPGNVAIAYGPEPAVGHVAAAKVPTSKAYSAPVPSSTPMPAISIQNNGAQSVSSAAASTIPAISALAPSVVVASVAPSSSSSSTSVIPYVAPTPAPSPPAKAPVGHIIGTTTYTSAGSVWVVAIEEIDITVTASVPYPSKHRRHAHQHRHIGDAHVF